MWFGFYNVIIQRNSKEVCSQLLSNDACTFCADNCYQHIYGSAIIMYWWQFNFMYQRWCSFFVYTDGVIMSHPFFCIFFLVFTFLFCIEFSEFKYFVHVLLIFLWVILNYLPSSQLCSWSCNISLILEPHFYGFNTLWIFTFKTLVFSNHVSWSELNIQLCDIGYPCYIFSVRCNAENTFLQWCL